MWRDRPAQSMLGETPFADRLSAQIRWHARSARAVRRDRDARDARSAAAVEAHDYTQQAIAAHLGLHFTSINRIHRKGRGQ